MVHFAADENFNRAIVRGVLRREPALDIVRVQDAGLSGADDRAVLEWSASERHVFLTYDVTMMTRILVLRRVWRWLVCSKCPPN